MPDPNNTHVRFHGGALARDELFSVLAYPIGLDGTDLEFTRVYTRHQENWSQQEHQSDIASMCYFPAGAERGWWLVGKRGDIHSITASGAKSEQIDKAGTGPDKLGYVKKIRVIDDSMYICGYRRQVYQRRDSQWLSIADAIHASKSEIGLGFNDIAGSGPDRLFAVGNRGEVRWFNGQSWQAVDTGTNSHLEAVALRGDQVFIAGRDGVILRGNELGFESVGTGEAGLNFWDIAVFQDRVFVSASAGVFELIGNAAPTLEPSPIPQHVGYRLAVSAGKLLSIGTHQLFAYDAQSSVELVCPDNT